MNLERAGKYIIITDDESKKHVFTNEEFATAIAEATGQKLGYDYPDSEIKNHAMMLTVNGKNFRCTCGANVFHRPRPNTESKIIYCNGCETVYEGE